MIITVGQIRAARAMLDLKQSDLAKKAGISLATLNNIERGTQNDPKISTLSAIIQALEKEGIEFTSDGLGGIGVNLKVANGKDNTATILIVDDNKADRTLYRHWLSNTQNKKKCIIFEADTARTGFDSFVKHRPDCIILDFMMYGTDGFQLLAALRREYVKLAPIIFVTGMHSETMEENARSQGVHAYLNKKTLSSDVLCAVVASACGNNLKRSA